MIRHQGSLKTRFLKTAFFSCLLLLGACARNYPTAPTTLNQNDPTNNGTGSTGTITTPPPPSITTTNPVCGNAVCESGETASSCASDCGTPVAPQTFTCTLAQSGGSPVATQAPQTPVPVQYLLSISPAVSTTLPQPTLATTPANAFTTSSVVVSGSTAVISGNFTVAGSITLAASLTISGQVVGCNKVITVTQAVTPTIVVSRFDRSSPPDIFYGTSNTGPAGYQLAGSMFKVFTQPPPASKCTSIPLNQCLLPRSPAAVTFLTQVANCGGYPTVSNVGYTCSTNVSGTTPLYRLTNNIDHRYFVTASFNDVSVLTNQGWIYEGIVGYAPVP